MNWLKKLFGVKPPIKTQEVKKDIYPSSTGYISYVPTGRTAETRYVESSNYNNQNNGDFLTSMMVAQATDSAALGMMIGGDPAGAIIGDMMNDNNHSNDHGSSNNDSWSSSNDYGSSNSDSSSTSNDW